MHKDFEQDAFPLRMLSGKGPSDAVQRRIVEGALSRTLKARQESPFRRLFMGLALAGAATAAVAVSLPMSPLGIEREHAAQTEITAATLDRLAEAGTYAIGPHVVEIAGNGRLHFQGVDPRAVRLQLEDGSARFEVESLATGDTFEVRTSQVLVQVVGTRFTVSADGSCSHVGVEEGRVRVLSPSGEPTYLGPGDSNRFCEPGAGAASARLGLDGTGEGLVREALVLVSQGRDLEQAAALLDRYRASYPNGAFEEEALFHLTLVKARMGSHQEAIDLAHAFEEAFPSSARSEKLRRLVAPAAP